MALKDLPGPTLTRREREVAALVADGLTNREIAERLFISERTADGHLEHIREKLAVSTRAQVAAWFVAQAQTAGVDVALPRARDRRPGSVRLAIGLTTLVVLVGAAVVVAPRLLTQPIERGPTIATVAGSATRFGGDGAYTGDGGLATSAQLSWPAAVTVDRNGDLYIADSANQAIRRVAPNGTISTFAGGVTTPFVEGGFGPTTGIGFVSSVALAPNGDLYFANGSIIAWVDANLSLHRFPANPIASPVAICFAPDGTLYIADDREDRVWKRSPDGTLSIYAGTGAHGFAGDNGAAAGAQLSYPSRLALDLSGNLYIADTGNNRIRKVDASGVITTVAGSADTYGYSGDGGPATAARLSLPEGVAVAPNGDVYIADTGNNRVRRIDARTGLITTVAGDGNAGLAGDGGAAIQAHLYGPVAIMLTSRDLFIVDSGNQVVRVVKGVVKG